MARTNQVDAQQAEMDASNDNSNTKYTFPDALDSRFALVGNILNEAMVHVFASEAKLACLMSAPQHFEEFVNVAKENFKKAEEHIQDSKKQMEVLKSEIKLFNETAGSSIMHGSEDFKGVERTTDGIKISEKEHNTNDSFKHRQSNQNYEPDFESDSFLDFSPKRAEKDTLNVSLEEINKTLDCKLDHVEGNLECSNVNCSEISNVQNQEHYRSTGENNLAFTADDSFDVLINNDHLDIDGRKKSLLDATLDEIPERLDNHDLILKENSNSDNHGYSKKYLQISNQLKNNLTSISPILGKLNRYVALNDYSEHPAMKTASCLHGLLELCIEHLSTIQTALNCVSGSLQGKSMKENVINTDVEIDRIDKDGNSATVFDQNLGCACEDCLNNETKYSKSCEDDPKKYASESYLSFHKKLNDALNEYILKSDRKVSEQFLYRKLDNTTSAFDSSVNNSQTVNSSSYITISEATTTDTSINDASYTSVRKDTSISDHWDVCSERSNRSNNSFESDNEASFHTSFNDSDWTDVSSTSSESSYSSGYCKKESTTESCSSCSPISSTQSSFSGDCTNGSYSSDHVKLFGQNISYASFKEGISLASLDNSRDDEVHDSETLAKQICENFENLNLLADTSLLGMTHRSMISSPYSYSRNRMPIVNKHNNSLISQTGKNSCSGYCELIDVVVDSDLKNKWNESRTIVKNETTSDILKEINSDLLKDIRIPRITISEAAKFPYTNQNRTAGRSEHSSGLQEDYDNTHSLRNLTENECLPVLLNLEEKMTSTDLKCNKNLRPFSSRDNSKNLISTNLNIHSISPTSKDHSCNTSAANYQTESDKNPIKSPISSSSKDSFLVFSSPSQTDNKNPIFSFP